MFDTLTTSMYIVQLTGENKVKLSNFVLKQKLIIDQQQCCMTAVAPQFKINNIIAANTTLHKAEIPQFDSMSK